MFSKKLFSCSKCLLSSQTSNSPSCATSPREMRTSFYSLWAGQQQQGTDYDWVEVGEPIFLLGVTYIGMSDNHSHSTESPAHTDDCKLCVWGSPQLAGSSRESLFSPAIAYCSDLGKGFRNLVTRWAPCPRYPRLLSHTPALIPPLVPSLHTHILES